MPLSGAAALLDAGRPVVTRCVRLNNYWCIKRARWNGEIGADEEGHVGFATAEQGADAAVTLLRRYYLDFGRRSALDVVRRWAPAECRAVGGAPLAGTGRAGDAASLPTLAVRGIAGTLRARWLAARRAPPRVFRAAATPPALAAGDPARPAAGAAGTAAAARPGPAPTVPAQARTAAPRPAARTASAATRNVGAPVARASVIPLRPLPAFRVPDIAAGMGERKPAAPAALLASRAPPPAARPTPTVMRGSAAPVRASVPRPASPAVLGSARLAEAPIGAEPPIVGEKPIATEPRLGPARTTGGIPSVAARPALDARVALAAPAPRPVLFCGSDEERIQNYAGRIVQGLELGPSDDLQLFEPNGTPRPNLARVLLAMSAVELGVLRAGVGLIEGAVERATAKVAPAEPAGDRDFTP